MRLCSRPDSVPSRESSMSDWRTWRTSVQAEERIFAPLASSAARITTAMQLRTAIERMRQRIGTERTIRSRPPVASLPLRSERLPNDAWWSSAIKDGSLHLADAIDHRADDGIRGGLGIDLRHRGFERLAVEVGHDRHTGLAGDARRLGLQRRPLLPHEAVRFPRGIAEDHLVGVAQALPCAQRHDQYLRTHGVLGERVVASKFVVAGGYERRPVVLGAVDEAGRKAGLDLAVGQLHRLRTQRANHLGHQLGLLDADAQPLEVREGVDRLLAVVDRAGAGIVKRQPDEAVLLEARENLVADRAVHHRMQVLDRAEQEGQRERVRDRNERAERPDIGAVDVDCAGAGLLDGLLLLAELARMEDPDSVAPVGALLDQ